MKLEEIGFYTLSNARAKNASTKSPMWRCELILTDRCNFNCPYCRGLRNDCKKDMPLGVAYETLDFWIEQGLKNVRFSGGEPTLYPFLMDLVYHCERNGVEKIAVSTNGSGSWQTYSNLIYAGVNDFSISLDGCCAAVGDKMVGGIDGAWEKITDNIRRIGARTYTTVGMVFTEDNVDQCVESVEFAASLGVSDIRVIPSAQYNVALNKLSTIDTFGQYPILQYRIDNVRKNRSVRGIKDTDSCKCWLALDDMVVAGKWHFPCIIYLREGGEPIGAVNSDTRQERAAWLYGHNTHKDKICSKMCLDVCVDYNNKAGSLK